MVLQVPVGLKRPESERWKRGRGASARLARPLGGREGRGTGDRPRRARGTAPRKGAGGWERRAGPGPACLDLCTEGRCCIPGQQEENTLEAQIPVQVIATINLYDAFLFLDSFILALEAWRSGTFLPHLGVRTCPWT